VSVFLRPYVLTDCKMIFLYSQLVDNLSTNSSLNLLN
jgi:hypothetical protein